MTKSLQLKSLVKEGGTLEIYLDEVSVPPPGPDQVVVRVEASPINPSDLGPLFGPADMRTASAGGTDDRPVLTATIPEASMARAAPRLNQPLAIGNEGAGVVVEAGSSPAAQDLLGKTVGTFGGGMYAQYRVVHVGACVAMEEGVRPAECASCFVNPMTVLSMVENMKLDGHPGLVHTAAASNLGQMLNRLCVRDGVPLVNVVRKPEQVALLREAGAKYVCNSTDPEFMNDLTDALAETGATIAFDAIGGGRVGSQILTCMERAANRNATGYSGYGSTTHKQLFVYGGLDPSPTELTRTYGMAWSTGGWLLTPFLGRIGGPRIEEFKQEVAAGIRTVFASKYTREVSLAGALQLDAVRSYGRQATGEKFLVTPNEGL